MLMVTRAHIQTILQKLFNQEFRFKGALSMKYLLTLVPLIFLFSISTANATDYYYCDCQAGASNQCVAGDDSNNGTSISSPKQTFANANSTFNSLAAGDSIQFCRGGSFSIPGDSQWVNNKCTAANKCAVTAYDLANQTSPQLSRPILTQNSTGHGFSLADGGNSDHEEGYSFSNLDLRCTGCVRNSGAGFFFYNDIDDVVIDNVSINGFNIGVSLQKSNPINTGDGKLDNITLNNLSIVNSVRQGIQGGANNLTVSNSYFENNGEGTILDHNIYISRGDNTTLKGNELYRSSLDTNGKCTGAPIVVHGLIDNLLIENNYVHEDVGKANQSCWGITVDTGYKGFEIFTNITIRGNKVVNVGNLSIGVTSCDTCIIENNVILMQQSFSSTAIRAPNKTPDSIDSQQNNVTIRNNSIFTSIGGTGIDLGTEGTGHIIVSNAVHYSGSGNFNCFNFNLPASAYTAVDNNTCFFPNSNTAQWEAGSGTSPSPLGAWQAQSGFGTNSKNINPEFTDPTLPLVDLSPKSTSQIIGAGHTTRSSQKDFRGKSRGNNPDAGAFEFGTFNPPAKTKAYFN